MTLASLQNEVLVLSEDERARLIEILWESLATPQTRRREQTWAEEAERRIDAIAQGNLSLRESGGVFTDLRKRLKS